MDWEEILLNGFEVGGTREQFEQLEYTEPVTVETKRPDRPSPGAAPDAHADPATAAAGRRVPRQHQRGGLPRGVAGGDPELGEPAGVRARGRKAEEGRRIRLRPCRSQRHRAGRRGAEAPAAEGEAPRRRSRTSRHRLHSMAEIEEMVGIIQKLDPPGIGARDLRECLLIQLRRRGDIESLTYRLVDEAFPDLIAHRWNDLGQALRRGARGGPGARPTDWPGSTPSRASSTRIKTTATSSPTSSSKRSGTATRSS